MPPSRIVTDSHFFFLFSTVNPRHVVKTFSSLQYICADFVQVLNLDLIKYLIETIGCYGKPVGDVNIAITAVGGLLWSLSDFTANQLIPKTGKNRPTPSPPAPLPFQISRWTVFSFFPFWHDPRVFHPCTPTSTPPTSTLFFSQRWRHPSLPPSETR